MADTDSTQTESATVTTATKTPVSLGFILVVRHAFADYQVGEEITNVSTINDILSGEQAVYVIKRAA